jgi:hypothetical protein
VKRKKKRNYRFGNVPTYETRNSIERQALQEFAWLSLPDPARRYDSSPSKPGRLCKRCRSFVAGERDRACPECYAV